VAVQVTVVQDVECEPAHLFSFVEDLTRYPQWLGIVHRVQATAPIGADLGPAWLVDLRGRLGPLARSKRVRMVRTDHAPGALAVFERLEEGDRSHSRWDLRSEVTSAASGSRLVMELRYGGGLWAPGLERLLRDEIERSRLRLVALATGAGPTR